MHLFVPFENVKIRNVWRKKKSKIKCRNFGFLENLNFFDFQNALDLNYSERRSNLLSVRLLKQHLAIGDQGGDRSFQNS